MRPNINKIIVHRVGNKLNDDGIVLSKSTVDVNPENEVLLNKYFLSSLKVEDYYTMYHESKISLNEIYYYASDIFANVDSFYDNSVNIAKHLYEKSEHPKIKDGDLFIVYFKDLPFEDQLVDAIGIYKSENKDTFIKIIDDQTSVKINFEVGLNINKIDKGCIIYNVDKENGFIVSVVDNLSRVGSEARYWKDDFLYVRPRRDEYHQTQNLLNLCKNFIVKELPQRFEISKADQVDYLNKSVQFFKERDNFEIQDFANQVMGQPEVIDSFNRFRQQFQQEQELEIPDQFAISESAVKRQARSIKSVIKLDKNFHIYVHGNRELIEQGVDENGRKFYKIYYMDES